jgi:hypothetical protein
MQSALLQHSHHRATARAKKFLLSRCDIHYCCADCRCRDEEEEPLPEERLRRGKAPLACAGSLHCDKVHTALQHIRQSCGDTH